MKKIVFILLFFSVSVFVFAQSTIERGQKRTDLIVFAAASMTESLNEIKTGYEKDHPVNIIYNFDSSGTLKTQIEMGAQCDVFISAATKQMDQLKKLNLIDLSTEIILLENRTVLAVPEGNPKSIRSFDQIAVLLPTGNIFMAIGNSDVPVGQYTINIFSYYGIPLEEITGYLTQGSNVKEVTTQIKAGSVDCGIIYETDAYSAGLEVVDTATVEMTGGRVVYPAAVTENSVNRALAKDFLSYLQSDEASQVFESVGFNTFN